MPIYDKPVRLLMREMAQKLNLTAEQVIERDLVIEWFARHYPRIKAGTVSAHLVLLSTNDRGRLHHKPNSNGEDDLFFRVATGRYRLYDRNNDPKPIITESDVVTEAFSSSETIEDTAHITPNEPDSEFAYEHDLRDYLARNLHLIELGLKLYQDEGINGIEFPVGGRFIDILAIDSSGGYVVIELKVSKGYDRVVGQLLRYIGWIKKNQADQNQRVRGVIVAKKISDDLLLACSELQHITLFEYSLSVSLHPITASNANQ